ncbi:hypothetical protein [Mycolicibacterium celeriflavum]|uniref:Uncharacterized protein n=1 Tax=Mycolicibacterium celeriflavum TaxID=1249101 RepID=A0A7I7RG69_MYCCF|nr:hypothetical protein [Mycolicibacterium celeriflavum]MCV7239558.1 hypothetical protein [Mycolicibacterium celeriflavum]BBY43250.1 hypothetical protein MCEL_15450 [Mycolicibacterium celeriflavum]
MARNPIRLSRRRCGGMQIAQGRSFILLDRDEAIGLIADAQKIIDSQDDGPERADTVSKVEIHT